MISSRFLSPVPLSQRERVSEGRVRESSDEYVQYVGIFAWGADGCWKEETCLVRETCVGNWIYQEDFAGGV